VALVAGKDSHMDDEVDPRIEEIIEAVAEGIKSIAQETIGNSISELTFSALRRQAFEFFDSPETRAHYGVPDSYYPVVQLIETAPGTLHVVGTYKDINKINIVNRAVLLAPGHPENGSIVTVLGIVNNLPGMEIYEVKFSDESQGYVSAEMLAPCL
jgi:hypothetical protein